MNEEKKPAIAVIVPARNEEKYVGALLDSFVAAQYPKDRLLVLICDGMSDDRTRAIVSDYQAVYPWIRLLDNEKQITPAAFNLGVKHAMHCDILVTVGAHAEIMPDYFNNIVDVFGISPEIGCVGGISENVYDNEISKAIGLAMSSPFGVGTAHFRTGAREGYVDAVSFPAYKKEVFEKVGLFNEELVRNQDDEFNYRVAKAGYKIYLSRSIRSRYYVRGSFDKLSKQYYQYGYWKVFVNRMHKTVTTYRQLMPPAFVLFVALGFVLAFFSSFLAGFYIGILFVYVVSGLVFASQASNNPKETMRVFYAFLILHFFYGMGYLKGVLDFNLLGKNPSEKAGKLTR